ncbi:MAG: type II toxin-antitoxin system RelE/ParE family toxin [Candidatus Hydrogenedentes bacterium]|nr:type II toxin-antitoxin system RelE/ParE family toxin [Candidatus Hydrogenedentota bacterium]
MKYWLHPEAREDLRDAASFCMDRAGAAFSQRFLSEFEHAVDLLLRHPYLGSAWRYGKRRLHMRRFPYSIIYTVAGEQIQIFAVAHHSRRPGYWRKRK